MKILAQVLCGVVLCVARRRKIMPPTCRLTRLRW